MKRIIKREDGTSILEFALVLPIFIALVLGVFDFGNGFNTYIGLSHAAREGAFWISQYPSDRAGMEARILSEASQVGLTADQITVDIEPDKQSYAAGETVTVSLHHNYQMMYGALTEYATLDLRTHTTAQILVP